MGTPRFAFSPSGGGLPPTTRFTALLTGDDLAIEGPSGRRRL
jgi:hypothetical protein